MRLACHGRRGRSEHTGEHRPAELDGLAPRQELLDGERHLDKEEVGVLLPGRKLISAGQALASWPCADCRMPDAGPGKMGS